MQSECKTIHRIAHIFFWEKKKVFSALKRIKNSLWTGLYGGGVYCMDKVIMALGAAFLIVKKKRQLRAVFSYKGGDELGMFDV